MDIRDFPLSLNVTLSSLPFMEFSEAMGRALTWAGPWSFDHVQLCPQNSGALDDSTLETLHRLSPGTRFRLHANTRMPGLGLRQIDASSPRHEQETQRYFAALAKVHTALHSPAYTLHAGRRSQASFEQMQANVLDLEQQLGTAVGVEGLYPTGKENYLLSTWDEYRRLLESTMHFAIDLSHLHILKTQSGILDPGLVQDLIAHPRCIEVHLSANNGRDDSHLTLAMCPTVWWFDLLPAINPTAVVFYEGDEIRSPERTRMLLGPPSRQAA